MKLTLVPHPHAAHIAIIVHDFSSGGSERIAIRLANKWAEAGRRVTILCGVADGPARSRLHPKVAVTTVWPPIPRSALSRVTLARTFAEIVRLLGPDLIFSPGNFHIPVLGIMARLLGEDRPTTITKISNPLQRTGRPRAVQSIFDRAFRWFTGPIDGFVAMSPQLDAEAKGVLCRSEVETIYEPNIDTLAGGQRHALGRPVRRGPTILCAGRLVSQKAFDLAIRAFALLDHGLDARLKILGEGPERLRLEVLVDKLGLNDRVTFAGYVPDIRPALATADLFLLSSRYEGYPAVIVEALAAGLPCVATDCSPALREMISHADLGDIVPATPRALADAMAARLARPAAVDASQLLARHQVDIVARQYLAYFDRTVGEHWEQQRKHARFR